MKKYPEWRVLVGFSLCPIVGALVISFDFFLSVTYENILVKKNLFGFFGDMIFHLFVIPFIGLLIYLIPAFASAVAYVQMQPERDARGYFTVALVGGMSVIFWNIFMAGNFSVEIKPVIFSFILGAFSSLVAARLVLPECEKNKDAVCAESES